MKDEDDDVIVFLINYLNINGDFQEQLKALSHLENRLKTHWKQKQKLLQKIRDKDRSLSKQHVRWQSN